MAKGRPIRWHIAVFLAPAVLVYSAIMILPLFSTLNLSLFTRTEGGTAFVRGDAAPDTARNLRRGQWRAGAELDLHGLRVEQARHALLSFLDECLEHGIRCVRVVHGKGYGSQGLEPVLKDKARTWLVQKAEVMAFSEAPEREGGAGALLVLLRQSEGARK